MKVLVLGKGFLGKEFEEMGYEVWGRDKFNFKFDDRYEYGIFEDYDAIVNCIGISNTRYCELPQNIEHVVELNGSLPSFLSHICKRHTIYEIATEMLDRKGTKMSGAELRKSQGLYLVNNVMDISKLKQYYQPPTVEYAIKKCYDNMKNKGVV